MGSEYPSPTHTHLPLHVFLSGWSMKPMGQLQWTPVAASWHLLSQPPLFTAHVSAWEGERKAAVRDCVQKTEGVMPPRCPPCHRLGVAESTNLPAEPVEAALGSHTTARRPQSREIMNTWGLVSPTNRASFWEATFGSSKEEEFNFPGTKS